MKILIVGGTGLIGTNVAKRLIRSGHTVIAGSPSTGVNALTGEGLSEALENTEVVIDLSNSLSFEDEPAKNFFETVGRNIISAGIDAGIKHHLTLSIVGTDQMQAMGYMKAKKIQEDLVINSNLPYTIVRSTQFQEFVPTIAAGSTIGNEIHVSAIDFQPIAADDVASFISAFATSEPANDIVEIAGPSRAPMSEFVEEYIRATEDKRIVISNERKEYFGTHVTQSTLVPKGGAYLGEFRFGEFLDSLKIKS